jgi:ribosomal protein L37E
MRAIAEVAGRLASRLLRQCPECRTPGFGRTGRTPGLPCRDCGSATEFTAHETHGCVACGFERRMDRPDGRRSADPAYCDRCNP